MKKILLVLFAFALTLAAVAQTAPLVGPPSTVPNTLPAVTLVPATTASALGTLLTNGEFWTALFALATGLFGIWRHQAATSATAQLTTAQKINQTLVLGIEAATQLPEVSAVEDKVKAVIQAKATEYGVQPILDRIVHDLTAPAASSGAAGDSHA